jgi:hypothetical protein
MEAPGEQISRDPEKLGEVKTYVSNAARWLVIEASTPIQTDLLSHPLELKMHDAAIG